MVSKVVWQQMEAKKAEARVITMQDFVNKYGTRGAGVIMREIMAKATTIPLSHPLFATSVELAGDLETALSSFLLEHKA